MPADRILVIDDQIAIAELVASVARTCGYETEVTTSPDVFLRRVESWKPSHLMLDLNMPVVDGVELLRHLAARKTQAQVVLMSGLEGKVVESARRLGIERGLDMAATLLKPFGASELLDLLQRLRVEANWCTEEGLAAALERGELFLTYLPKVELQTSGIASFEALVRWRHPKYGVIGPDRFLPLAEGNWLIERITDVVLDLAMRQLRDWGEAITTKVAINLSGVSLSDEALPDRLVERCEAFGILPDRIELELSETSAMADAAHTSDVLTRLRLKGFQVVLDDFGTGYSSLLQLARLPFSEIKIDKSFVLDCPASREAMVIVKSIIDLAHNLNLRAVAEGVQNAELYRLMTELGCDLAQGYHITEPLLAEQVPKWVAEWRERRHVAEATPAVPAATAPPPRAVAVWTKAYDGSPELKAALAQLLSERIQPLWGLGRNSLVGWRPVTDGIEVLIMPYRRIVDQFGQSRRLLRGKRLMGHHTFDTARELAGCSPVRIPLPFRISDTEKDAVPTHVIEQVLRRYGITETLHRAVALFDIVGFSKFEPSRQIAQLNSLECSISTAQKLMQEIGRKVDLARTTTGDGFYIWNRDKGAGGDIDTYLLTLLALADNAIAQKDGGGEFVPELRTCFAIGPHYSYYQIEGLDPHGHDYIVGDVTISLARMISKCLSGQILIHDFVRPADDENEATNPIDFMIQADTAFLRLTGTTLQDRRIETIRCYLTGMERHPGAFDISRYTIQDKHGFEHAVFNQKFNISVTDLRKRGQPSDMIFLGKREADLADFDADSTPLNLTPEAEVA